MVTGTKKLHFTPTPPLMAKLALKKVKNCKSEQKLYKDLIEKNFPGIFSADTGQPQALDGIESKKNQF